MAETNETSTDINEKNLSSKIEYERDSIIPYCLPNFHYITLCDNHWKQDLIRRHTDKQQISQRLNIIRCTHICTVRTQHTHSLTGYVSQPLSEDISVVVSGGGRDVLTAQDSLMNAA